MTSARETQDPLTATADCQQAIVGPVEFAYTLPYALLTADHYEEVIAEVDEAFAELASRPSYLGSELSRMKGGYPRTRLRGEPRSRGLLSYRYRNSTQPRVEIAGITRNGEFDSYAPRLA